MLLHLSVFGRKVASLCHPASIHTSVCSFHFLATQLPCAYTTVAVVSLVSLVSFLCYVQEIKVILTGSTNAVLPFKYCDIGISNYFCTVCVAVRCAGPF